MAKIDESDEGFFWLQAATSYYKLQPSGDTDTYVASWVRALKHSVVELDSVEDLKVVANARTWSAEWERIGKKIKPHNVCIVRGRVGKLPDMTNVWCARYRVKGTDTQDDRILRLLHKNVVEHLVPYIMANPEFEGSQLRSSLPLSDNKNLAVSANVLKTANPKPITALPKTPPRGAKADKSANEGNAADGEDADNDDGEAKADTAPVKKRAKQVSAKARAKEAASASQSQQQTLETVLKGRETSFFPENGTKRKGEASSSSAAAAPAAAPEPAKKKKKDTGSEAAAKASGKATAKENGKAVRTEVGTEAAADADGGSKEKLEGGLFFVCDLEDLKHIRKKLSNIRGPPWMFDVKHAA